MAAIYVLGAAVTGSLMLVMCLAAGLGVFLSFVTSYLGAVVVMGLIMLTRLWAIRQQDQWTLHDEAEHSPSFRHSA